MKTLDLFNVHLRKGNYVSIANEKVLHEEYSHQVVAKILGTDSGWVYLQFKDGSTTWTATHAKRGLVKITKKEYDNFKVKTFKERLKNVKFWD